MVHDDTDDTADGPTDGPTDGPADAPLALTDDTVLYAIAWHMDSQRRIYDVLLALLAAQGHDGHARDLQAAHERGEFLYPPPGRDAYGADQ